MQGLSRCATALTLILLFGAAAAAQEVPDGLAGAWTLSFSSSQGSVSLPVDLTPTGAELRGTSGSAMGYQTDFGEGSVTADGFTFEIWVEVSREWYPLDFEGRVVGGELIGDVDIPDGTSSSFRGVRPTSD